MRRSALLVEGLEARHTPATLDLVGGALTYADAAAEDNSLTVAVSAGVYSFNDSIANIALGAGATAAGWKGDGTHTVSGPEAAVAGITVSAGGGANAVNLRSLHHPTEVDGDSGTTTVNVNSVAPLMIGNLAGIQAPVAVNAGADTRLNVSDFGGVARPTPVIVNGSGVTGLSPFPISLSGSFPVMTVQTSNVATLAETVVVDAPPSPDVRLLTNGGDDTVMVTGDLAGQINTGAGNDVIIVAAGVTFDGPIHTGPGIDAVFVFGTHNGVED